MPIDSPLLFALIIFAVAMIATLVMVQKLNRLSVRLNPERDSGTDAQERLQRALYGGERHLREVGVHGDVWTIRGLFFFETICILAFTYLLYVSEVA